MSQQNLFKKKRRRINSNVTRTARMVGLSIQLIDSSSPIDCVLVGSFLYGEVVLDTYAAVKASTHSTNGHMRCSLKWSNHSMAPHEGDELDDSCISTSATAGHKHTQCHKFRARGLINLPRNHNNKNKRKGKETSSLP